MNRTAAFFIMLLLILICTGSGIGQRKHSRTLDYIPENVSNYGLTREGLNETNVDSLGRKLIDGHSKALNVSIKNIKKGKIQNDGIWWMASYAQTFNGIPVEGSEIGFTIGQTGNIISLGATTFDSIKCEVTPSLTKENAVAVAKRDIGGTEHTVYGDPLLVILPE
jgi:hypothetical protein